MVTQQWPDGPYVPGDPGKSERKLKKPKRWVQDWMGKYDVAYSMPRTKPLSERSKQGSIMEFTKENWENAPERARLEWSHSGIGEVRFIGWGSTGLAVIEADSSRVWAVAPKQLRIILPKRKVMVQLWRTRDGEEVSRVGIGFYANWTLLGEHTFEIEGE